MPDIVALFCLPDGSTCGVMRSDLVYTGDSCRERDFTRLMLRMSVKSAATLVAIE